MANKLYAEFRVYFDARTNQDLLQTMCIAAQERIYDMFDGIDDESSGPLPAPHDVTFEVVMEVEKEEHPFNTLPEVKFTTVDRFTSDWTKGKGE